MNSRLGGLEVAFPPRKSKVEGSIPTGVDRFSRCGNRRHASYDFMACKRSIKFPFGSGTLGKIKSCYYLASD
ncbi:hypothetical protein TNCV_3356681 [Trichonephila clavipes]|nr:hypothetical protein TNCV_3356681 [Trichonephila clavipes]